MSKEAVLSTRVPKKVKRGLTELAKATDRPISWHVAQALTDYVEVNRWHVAEIRKGLDEVKAGEWMSHDEVAAWVKSLGKPDELPTPVPRPTAKCR